VILRVVSEDDVATLDPADVALFTAWTELETLALTLLAVFLLVALLTLTEFDVVGDDLATVDVGVLEEVDEVWLGALLDDFTEEVDFAADLAELDDLCEVVEEVLWDAEVV